MAGLDPMEVYSNKAAARRGLGPKTAGEVDVVGADWRALAPGAFKLPARDPSAMMPAWLGKRLRGWATARPVLERASDCTRCKKCEESCPVGAIVVRSDGPVFDHSICIRCYCCQELCPPQAIGLTTPPLARFATRGRGI
jgi:ferredoxin